MALKLRSRGICPVCQCNVYVANPFYLDGRPYHQTCYIVARLGLR